MKKALFIFGAIGLFVSMAFQRPPDMPTVRTSVQVNIDKEKLQQVLERVVEEIAGKSDEDTAQVKEEEDTSDS